MWLPFMTGFFCALTFSLLQHLLLSHFLTLREFTISRRLQESFTQKSFQSPNIITSWKCHSDKRCTHELLWKIQGKSTKNVSFLACAHSIEMQTEQVVEFESDFTRKNYPISQVEVPTGISIVNQDTNSVLMSGVQHNSENRAASTPLCRKFSAICFEKRPRVCENREKVHPKNKKEQQKRPWRER